MSKLIHIDSEYKQWIQELKSRYRRSQIKASVHVNREMLAFYWELGREIVHVANKHRQELASLGMEAFNYVTMIINQSDEVRRDSRDALFFIVSGARQSDSDLEQCAVVELKIEWMGKKKVYIIKSARPMNWGRLRKIELVCVKPRS